MAVERNAGKGAESTNAAFIQGQKNGNNKSSGGQKEHKDSSHIWKKTTKKHLDDLQDWENILWTDKTRQDKKKNVLEGLSHVTCDVNVRTKHYDND